MTRVKSLIRRRLRKAAADLELHVLQSRCLAILALKELTPYSAKYIGCCIFKYRLIFFKLVGPLA